ncbi:MAG: hypothetical protein ACE145_00805 [Terriglobia bacterium]
MPKKALGKLAVLFLASLMAVAGRAADKPLDVDDVTLLLLGGATTDRMVALIDQRGVAFQMTPDLAKKFHDAGADDIVIEKLQKAGMKAQPAVSAAPATPPQRTPSPPTQANAESQPRIAPAAAPSIPTTPVAASSSGAKSSSKLSEPSPAEIDNIIREFAAKEKIFREARNNYTYHQINKVQQLDPDGNTVGTFQQEWDILYDDSGKRIERVTYAPPDTLKNLIVTKEDLDAMRNIQPFVLSTDELPEYEVKYLGHVKLDEITAYVFSIRPKEIKKDRLYFQGMAWVDDRDLQIVKTDGKIVPQLRTKQGENLFPRFTTYREQIDGKFWFPTYTMAKDTLYFSSGAVDIKQTIRYTDYKQFKSKVRIVSTEVADSPSNPPNPPAKPNK